ncbi:flavin reductase family protein [Corynebacterium comes]|uniref:Flavin-dependent monooxygenase, reductase subunit HsaB n=1 Tax=Corynebacterium comes TaxID=2675218 RepID=A0A6B8VKE7_9CORY|nr:flavin reductase family protein [Corynebacterium comes]QGU05872.1 Flavin-dependent monooxygenase, reductase subunit HsaB [Corynebacterium comes]
MTNVHHLDPALFREALGHHPTGVAVISSIDAEGQPIGLVVGTFNSVSLDPPLVGFFPMRESRSWAEVQKAGFFTVNIFAHDQEDVCRALTRRQPDKFAGLNWTPSTNGSPVLDDVVLSIDCTLADVAPAGDHHFVTGLVEDVTIHRPVPPLLFFQGGYGGFVPRSFVAPSDAIIAEAVQLVQSIRTDMEELATATDGEVAAYALVEDHAVAVAVAKAENLSAATVIGSKIPLTPPFGEVFLTNAPQSAIDDWFAKADRMGEDIAGISRQRLTHLQANGWTGSHTGPYRDSRLFPALVNYGTEEITPARDRELRNLLTEAASDLLPPDARNTGRHPGASLVAPILNSDGRCTLMLRLSHLPRLSVPEVEDCGRSLLEIASRAHSGSRHTDTREMENVR